MVVAASNSKDATNVDYICDGTDDQEEVNAALNALPAGGGMVVLLEGTFHITGTITIPKSNVALVGRGAGTVLAASGAANLDTVYAYEKNHILVANLKIDGSGGTGGIQGGILFADVTYSKIVDCWVENMRGTGIHLYIHSDHNTITGNNVQSNGSWGIFIAGSNNTITGNNCQGNYQGISLSFSSSHNTITGNNVQSNGSEGISLTFSSNNNTISGNNCQGNGEDGIFLLFSPNNNTISGNTCQGNGEHGIDIHGRSDNNTVVGNTVVGNSQSADNAYDGIYLGDIFDGADHNLIVGNLVRRGTAANKQRYGINVSDDACDRNCLIGNDLYDSGSTGDLNDVPFTNPTLKHDNRNNAGTGWLAEV